MSKSKKRNITSQKENFARWYQDVVREAELAENSEVRGCGIVKPYGFKIWELLKKELSKKLEEDGVENVYFPIFVPIKNLEAEKDHVEGFAPELAIVTHGGGKDLENKLAVRPTSEAAMYKTYAKWIKSYNDLPIRYNQWNNVVRWEKRPRAFLRWSEFLWQEGHSVFSTEKEAREEVWKMLGIYEDIYKNLALPVFKGYKSNMEKFAGAEMTTTVETMTKDGKAIQGATSHYLGTNFSKVFNVKYLGKDGKEHYGYQTSWGFSWRSIGALIMGHGDDQGLRLPPNVAPIQIVLVPIFRENNKHEVLKYTKNIEQKLSKKFRTKLDDRENFSPGFKFNEWEIKGVPLRLEIGGKEVEKEEVTIFRRDLNEKENILINEDLEIKIEDLFKNIQTNLYNQALSFTKKHIHRIENIDEIKDQIGFFKASWSEDSESEKLLKEKFSMVSRCLPVENENKKPKNERCFITGKKAKHDWLFAKSY